MSREDVQDKARSAWRFWLAGALLLLAVILSALWLQRAPLAENFIARELARRDVRASYDLIDIGLRTQRIENLVLGDPRRPDLTARSVEVDIAYGGIIPGVAEVRATGVRLRGSLKDGTLSLGELDKFRDPTSTAPFSLPDIGLVLRDAAMTLDTDFGRADLTLQGDGNLRSGFAGNLAARMQRAQIAGCALVAPNAMLTVSIRESRPRFVGPIRATAFGCPTQQIALAQPSLAFDLLLGEALDRWRGRAVLEFRAARLQHAVLDRSTLDASFAGDARETRGDAQLSAGGASGYGARTGLARIGVRYAVAGQDLRVSGTTTIADLRDVGGDPLRALRGAADGTPIGPLAAKLADAVRAAAKGNSLSTAFAINQRRGKGSLGLSALNFSGGSGARIAMAPESRFAFAWPDGNWEMRGALRSEGGGLPTAALSLTRPTNGRGLAGQLFLADYAARDARLSAQTLRFVAAEGGRTRFDTQIKLTGPLPGGSITNLALPISGLLGPDGSVRINPGCTPIGFDGLVLSSMRLAPAKLTLCPGNGGALVRYGRGGVSGDLVLRAPRLSGRIGSSPLRLAASDMRYSLVGGTFAGRDIDVSIGRTEAPVLLRIAGLEGHVGTKGFGGNFAGGSGRIGAVPLQMSQVDGRWGFAKGALLVDGGLRVSDTQSTARFQPVVSRDFRFLLSGDTITANGTLLEPRNGLPVVRADIAHRLSNGVGHADLIVDRLAFGPTVQPSDLTSLALGVVADVHGVIDGQGRIDWTPQGATSSGTFRTDGTDLAAAFGPVTGLSGQIHFTDLLNLATAPGQEFRVGVINPGIPVKDGVIRYQLLPGSKVRIEQGLWPFAGGRLLLEPALMDFSASVPRRMTLRVEALNAAAFLQQFDFQNIHATGIFDGVLPMVFDETGGRVENGRLAVREGGGSLAYIGDLTEEDLGSWGNFAFQMLRSVNYRTLAIIMNGQLDGELVTEIDFTGLSQGQGAKVNFLTRKIAALPIHFNVTIRAPFRQLVFSAKSFYDPSLLIEQNLPALIQAQERSQIGRSDQPGAPSVPQSVQPAESGRLP